MSVYVKYKLYTPHQNMHHINFIKKYFKILKSEKVFGALRSTGSDVPVKLLLI